MMKTSIACWGAAILLTWGIALDGTMAADPEDSGDESGLEINLDALEGLEKEKPAPDRDSEPLPEPPAAEEQAPVLPPPPVLDAEKDSAPPELKPAPAAVEQQPAPKSPSAPPVENVSIKKTPAHIAKKLTGRVVTVLFDGQNENLSLAASERLNGVAKDMSDTAIRLQLFAYAGTEKQSPSETRRLALKRAIAVRGHLMDRGVDGAQIDLRPQGPAEDGAPERVDVKYVVR